MTDNESLPPLPLPPGIEEFHVQTSDLKYHVLSAGSPTHPLLLLLHGFPELAFSWRKIMVPLAELGYHVVAYDQRGYGRTTGWDTSRYEQVDLHQFGMNRIIIDALRLVNALGHKSVHCLIGHDFGAVAASWCALSRPDFFQSLIIMSHPFRGAPTLPNKPSEKPTGNTPTSDPIHSDLANLLTPRKAYKWYYSSGVAAQEMDNPSSTLNRFLRAYFHLKSADWKGNDPFPLKEWSAEELANMPGYYVMPLHAGMRESCELDLGLKLSNDRGDGAESEEWQDVERIGSRWMNDAELGVFVDEFKRNGFQGALNWYRCFTEGGEKRELEVYAGKLLAVPLLFVGGAKDWGLYQEPGAFEKMAKMCMDGMFKGSKIVQGAGHWVQQEQPEAVIGHVADFLRDLKA